MPTVNNNKRPWQPEHKPHERRANTNAEFYHTPAWRAARKAHLMRQPLCVECMRNNKITSGRVVDHIKPINQGGAHLDGSNLQTLCDTCHNIKSATEAHAINNK